MTSSADTDQRERAASARDPRPLASTSATASEHRRTPAHVRSAAASGGPWLFSKATDVAAVLGPLSVATVLLLLVEGTGVKTPLWAYLLAFVAVDVAHVWATSYVTFLDRERFEARRALYVGVVVGSTALALGLHLVGPAVFWSALAYFAIFHFARQQWGFIRLYARKAGEVSDFERRLDALTLAVGVLVPVVTWHAAPVGHFDWFDAGERFFVRPPASIIPVLWAVMAVVGAVYVAWQLARRRRGHPFNVGRLLWMGGSWVSWTVGLRFTDDLLLSAAFLNFFHGVPFLVLVHRRVAHKWHVRAASPRWAGDRLLRAISARGKWYLFYGVILLPALVEEGLWDALVWRSYLDGDPLVGVWRSVAIAALVTPQLAHYFLDGIIWRKSPHNADLGQMLQGASS